MGAEKTAEVGLVIIGTADSTTSVMNDNSSISIFRTYAKSIKFCESG